MALIIPAGFGQIAYRFSLTNDPDEMIVTVGVNVLFGAPGPQETVDLKADQFMAGFTAAGLYVGWTFLGCVLRTDNSGGGSAIFEAPRNMTGTAVGETPPQNCCVLVRKNTAGAGRRNRGRMYLPPFGLAEGDVSKSGMISSALVPTLQSQVTNGFMGDDMVILHDSVATNTPPGDPTPITGFVVDNRIATQRRRLR
jgi:hypothetical protein